MAVVIGLAFVLIAGFLQGSFYLPGTYTKRWEWEHTWTFFSLFGMIVFSWIFILATVPDIISVYRISPSKDIVILLVFGGLWGIGAVCTGLAMDRLGMALAFPIVIGIVSALGALIPLIVFFPADLIAPRGLVVIAGTVIAVVGIIVCSRAFALKERSGATGGKPRKGSMPVNLAIAITAGVMSSLLNIGFAYSTNLVAAARELGVSGVFAANAAWAVILTTGGVVNVLYCVYLMAVRRTFGGFFVREGSRNLVLGIAMGLIWCAGLYVYGMGAASFGSFGVVVGWVLVTTINIITGNLWGIRRGEWAGAPARARALLNSGMIVLIVAIVIVALSNTM